MTRLVVRPKYLNFKVGVYPNSDEFDACEAKIDGWFTRLDISDGQWKLWSRTSRLIDGGQIDSSIKETTLYSEYLFGTEWAKDQDEYGRLCVFGADVLEGQDLSELPNSEVRSLIDDFLSAYCYSEEIIKKCFLIPQFSIDEAPAVWDELVVKNKFEGLVFKNSNEAWGSTMGRMKQVATMDYVCMDVLESISETYAGWGAQSIVGGLYVDGELVQRCKVPGMTDEQREEFLKNKDKYIGRVLECKGKKISKRGSIRHPEFIRWRDDKSPEDCKWEV